MILMIDNYDSFTYNLVQYLKQIGEDVVVKRNDAVSVDEIAVMAPQAIVISPGPGRPASAGISLAAIQRFSGISPSSASAWATSPSPVPSAAGWLPPSG
jgi:anthranilate synthase/phosphoribosyltransferase